MLGRYGPFPAPGGACSSYLVEAPAVAGKDSEHHKKVRLVFDLGSGTLSRLLMLCRLEQVDAILLSHLHSDHMSDMFVLRYALEQLHKRGVPVPTPLNVIAPDSPEYEFRGLASSGTFNMVRAQDGMRLRFGSLSITLHEMLHPVPTFGFDILENDAKSDYAYGEEKPKKRLFYTGDTGMHHGLYALVKGASLLLADTNLLSHEKTTEFAPHMTAKEAGILARSAGVGRLICTHIWGGAPVEEELLLEARANFPASEIAQEARQYIIE